MKTWRAAVVGTGFIGPVHVEGLRRAGVDVLGVLGSSLAKSEAAAGRMGIPRAYGSYSELLQDADIDVVHLTTPNRHHHAEVIAALEAKKHVLCEKPLAMNARESADLVARAAASDRVCGVNYNVRFYPLCHEARERVRQQLTGPIFHVTGAYVQDWLLYDTDFNWRVLADEGGSLRAIADIGTHWLDLIQFVLDRPVVAVCADLLTVHPVRQAPIGGRETFTTSASPAAAQSVPIGTEDYGTILLEFAGGTRGAVSVSQVTAGRKNCLRFEIAGQQEALAWDSERPNELWIGRRDAANSLFLRDPGLMQPAAAAVSSYPGGHNEGFPDTFKQLFRAYYGYLSRGSFAAPRPFPTFEDGHREILLCEAILASHRERRWVRIDEVE